MLAELTPEEFSDTLDAVADDVLALLPARDAPIDALRLARALGLAVAWDQRQSGRGRIARLAGRSGSRTQGSILLRPEPRRERLQWAIAHEVGELCAHRVFERLSVDPREAPPAAREAVANRLASRLLLPRDPFERDGRETGWDLFELKARFFWKTIMKGVKRYGAFMIEVEVRAGKIRLRPNSSKRLVGAQHETYDRGGGY